MDTLPTIVNGQEGSASQIMSAFNYILSLGQTNLENLQNIRTETLLAFQRRVSYLNSKQQTANKLINQNALVNFTITDFSNVNQSETTATVRIDSNVVTSSEQAFEVEAIIKSVQFTSNLGNVEALNQDSSIYRVYNTNGSTPTGSFFITLTEPTNLSVLVFDLPSIASNPVINITTSDTGILYTSCLSYSLNGYRLIVYLTPAEIQYIKIDITPSHPDNLGGSLFTFGLTDFIGSSTQYRLLSEFVSQPINFIPNSVNCQLNAIQTDGLLYFLSLGSGNFIEVSLATSIPIPAVSETNLTAVGLNSNGLLNSTISSLAYLSTIEIIDVSTGTPIPLLYGLLPTNSSLATLNKSYISLVQASPSSAYSLYYIPYISEDSSKTFNISYVSGPASVSAQLKIQISTNDKNSSPIFTGATLLNA
jgi:hypothetical protein